jgi:predicted HAD superfamily Cof-like phosphohydrolase
MIESILRWHKVARSNPSIYDLTTQLGCHLEEVAEMLTALQINGDDSDLLESLHNDLVRMATALKSKRAVLRLPALSEKVSLLDSLCDQIVTAMGVAYCAGMDIAGALKEVDDSNWSKFEDGKPVFDANGKIKKGRHYQAPQLEKYLF